MSIDYAKTVVGATYWMFYTMEDSASIGVASATTAAGPYTDRGEFLSAASIGSMTIKNPFFIVSSTSFYLCYSADDGTYIQPVKLSKSTGAKISGTAIKISGTDFKDIAIVRASSSRFYLMGTVSNGKGTEIHYAMASKITGPYVDKNGTDLTTGSKGEQLIVDGTEIVNAENPMRGFFNTTGSYLYLAYNATQIGQEMMASGYARRPMFLTPFKVTEDGWLDSSCQAKKGWTFPRFE
jgi:beta-xylosidase